MISLTVADFAASSSVCNGVLFSFSKRGHYGYDFIRRKKQEKKKKKKNKKKKKKKKNKKKKKKKKRKKEEEKKEDVPFVEFMYFVFTRMPGES